MTHPITIAIVTLIGTALVIMTLHALWKENQETRPIHSNRIRKPHFLGRIKKSAARAADTNDGKGE